MAIAREFKDKLFKFIFGREENKEWTLSLYNAVNGTHYTDTESLKFTTIEDVLYIRMKNDVSFLIADSMNFYEQQTTENPNLPLRCLIYAAMSYSRYIDSDSVFIYSTKPQHIPSPRCICFYNGTKETEEKTVLKLSSLYDSEGDIEVKVTMLNINHGKNKDILESCEPLAEYSWFVDTIRYNQKEKGMAIDDAVGTALDDMPDEYVIKPFLLDNRAEVNHMCLTEYDEAKYTDNVRAEGKAEGIEEGRAQGKAGGLKEGRAEGLAEGEAKGLTEGKIKAIIEFMKDGLISEEDAAKRANMTLEDFRKAEALYCS